MAKDLEEADVKELTKKVDEAYDEMAALCKECDALAKEDKATYDAAAKKNLKESQKLIAEMVKQLKEMTKGVAALAKEAKANKG